ncbi:MAG: T9SS type A sorting domain-containing protein [Bacteroidota bacterium]
MKKAVTTIGILLFFAVAFTASAQPYLMEGNIWKDFRGGSNGSYSYHDVFTTVLSGDTLINGQTYHKALVFREATHSTDSTVQTDPIFLDGTYFVREEGKKFYFMERGYEQELVLADFDLQLGDTVEHVWCHGQSLVVERVDTLSVGNRRLAIYIFDNQWAMIEGVGSTAGFINGPCGLHGFTRTLECFQIGDDLFDDWKVVSRNCDLDIDLITSTIEADAEAFIQGKLYPNPTNNELNIQLENAHLQCIDVHDLYGRSLLQLKEQTLPLKTSTGSYRLDVATWPDGLYHVRLQTDRGIFSAFFQKQTK